MFQHHLSQSGVFHDNTFYNICRILAVIKARLKVIVYLKPGYKLKRILLVAEKLVNKLGIKMIAVAFQGVNLNKLVLDSLGGFKASKLCNGLLKPVSAFNYKLAELQSACAYF